MAKSNVGLSTTSTSGCYDQREGQAKLLNVEYFQIIKALEIDVGSLHEDKESQNVMFQLPNQGANFAERKGALMKPARNNSD